MNSNPSDSLASPNIDPHAGSPDRFGYEWSNYSVILPENRVQLQRWLGSLKIEDLAGLSVLDVGCGMGRNPYWMAQSAARVVAVDVDDNSVNAARKNLAPIAHATVKKCSVYELSKGDLGTFDVVTCIGVLHHLEDPNAALKELWSRVQPKGELVLWVYGKAGNELFLPIIQALRFVGSRLPIRMTHGLSKIIALFAWPFFQIVPFKNDYYKFIRKLSYRNLESIIFDQILPRIANYWTEEDLKELTAPLNGQVTIEKVQENSWTVRVRRIQS